MVFPAGCVPDHRRRTPVAITAGKDGHGCRWNLPHVRYGFVGHRVLRKRGASILAMAEQLGCRMELRRSRRSRGSRSGRSLIDSRDSIRTIPKLSLGSVLNIVEELNYNADGRQRQLYGYGISAKRYGLYTRDDSGFRLIKVSEHGLGLYYRPKKGRDPECEVPVWIKQGWEWMLNRALGISRQEPEWFRLPVMRRIAISTPNVMAAASSAT